MDRLLTKHLQRCLWTTTPPNNKSGSHRCVVAIRRNYAVTYQHKGHSKLKLNDRLTIYNVMDLKVTLEVGFLY
uniref:Ovule protein n=1 Tax=Panagrellus redivivus TaxID=6233 RepID=A0A7E4V2Q3_PANRE